MWNVSIRPYKRCKGRKYRVIEKLYRSKIIKKRSIISNHILTEKNKVRFLTQLFRWFRKDNRHYRLNYFLVKKYIISNNDQINLSTKIQKAGWKKLLQKLNLRIKDYKELKRRSYTLNFTFFFLKIEDKKNKDITLDIRSMHFDNFYIFITLSGFYIEELYYIIDTLNNKENINI